MDIVLTVIRAIWILFLVVMVFNLMILVHEWGHFLAGRWRGLYIDRFQIWFGKPLWKKTINGVQYGLGSIPAGGFVSLPQMAPMESIEGSVDEKVKSLPPITPLDKIIVAFAGPLFSFLLAVFFAVLVWFVGNPTSDATTSTTIGQFYYEEDADGNELPNAAEEAGLRVGDKIKEIDGKFVDKFMGMNDSVMWAVISSDQEILNVKFDRPGEGEMSLDVAVPRPEQKKVEGGFLKRAWAYVADRPPLRRMGIFPAVPAVVAEISEHSPAAESGLKKGDRIASVNDKPIQFAQDFYNHGWDAGETYKLGVVRKDKDLELEFTARIPEVPEDFDKALAGIQLSGAGGLSLTHPNPIEQVTKAAKSIGNMLKALFTPKSGVSPGHLNGPVGIMGAYWDLFQTEDGWKRVLWFSVLLNVNLGILNLLPFPVLDGGHIVMAIYEWIRKKPIHIRVLEVVQTAFVLLLFSFMLYVSFKDVGDRVPKGADPEAEVQQQKAPRFLSPEEKASGVKTEG